MPRVACIMHEEFLTPLLPSRPLPLLLLLPLFLLLTVSFSLCASLLIRKTVPLPSPATSASGFETTAEQATLKRCAHYPVLHRFPFIAAFRFGTKMRAAINRSGRTRYENLNFVKGIDSTRDRRGLGELVIVFNDIYPREVGGETLFMKRNPSDKNK